MKKLIAKTKTKHFTKYIPQNPRQMGRFCDDISSATFLKLKKKSFSLNDLIADETLLFKCFFFSRTWYTSCVISLGLKPVLV